MGKEKLLREGGVRLAGTDLSGIPRMDLWTGTGELVVFRVNGF